MAIRRVTAEQFKKAVAEKSDLADLAAIKGVATEVKQDPSDGEQRILTFTISTADVDRDGDTIDPNGWELDNFIKGGSMLWGHDPDKVIAAPLATWVENGRLRSRARFPSKEESEFAFSMYQLFRGGFVRGTSVGFIPKEWTENSERGGWYPTDFKRQELLEYSGTPIPSNPNALMDAKSKGVDFKSFIPLVEPIMDGETNLFVPRELAEEIYNTAKDTSTVYSLPAIDDKSADEDPPESKTATDLLSDVSKQIDKACEMIAAKSVELSADIKTLLSVVGQPDKISDENKQLLREAMDALSSVIGDAATTDDKGADIDDDDGDVLDLSLGTRDAESIEIDEKEVDDALRSVIRNQVNESIRQALGRVD